MTDKPNTQTMAAWANLIRSSQKLLNQIEAELKTAGLPALGWYDVLLELSRTETGSLRPKELEENLLLSQYNISRLIDRMEKAGLVQRLQHPDDRRAQTIQITDDGRQTKDKIWEIYAPFLQEAIAGKLSIGETETLISLLRKL